VDFSSINDLNTLISAYEHSRDDQECRFCNERVKKITNDLTGIQR